MNILDLELKQVKRLRRLGAREITRRALRTVNRIRKANGYSELPTMPTGLRYLPGRCPMAVALGMNHSLGRV